MNKFLANSENIDEQTALLLAKYFAGNASDEDSRQLDVWIASSPQNEAEFLRMTKLFELTGLPNHKSNKFDTAKAKQNFDAYMSQSKSPNKTIALTSKSVLRNWLFRAAIIVGIIVASALLWNNFSNNEIVLASNTTIKNAQLPDGTTLTLAPNSIITYDKKFALRNKQIILSGEAKFAINNKENGKLRVLAGETIIEDIGTVFKVSAFPHDDYVQVSVSEGMVQFYSKNNAGIIINAHESGLYNKRTKTFALVANSHIANENKSIMLNLENVTLIQAVDIIGNAYNVDIQMTVTDAANKQITVSFNNEDIVTVLHILGQTLGLHVEKKGEGYYLRE
jgi:transmembrane sensor